MLRVVEGDMENRACVDDRVNGGIVVCSWNIVSVNCPETDSRFRKWNRLLETNLDFLTA
jgi:hypothetical protein